MSCKSQMSLRNNTHKHLCTQICIAISELCIKVRLKYINDLCTAYQKMLDWLLLLRYTHVTIANNNIK